jgi:hypothetical protein
MRNEMVLAKIYTPHPQLGTLYPEGNDTWEHVFLKMRNEIVTK